MTGTTSFGTLIVRLGTYVSYIRMGMAAGADARLPWIVDGCGSRPEVLTR